MNVYTGRGDDGTTTGYDGDEYNKDDLRIELVGVLDEFMASLDEAIVALENEDKVELLDGIQDILWQTAGEISLGEPGKNAEEVIDEAAVEDLESCIDLYNPQISHFVRYRTEQGTTLNRSRVVCRRLERRLTPGVREGDVRSVVYTYINRLSDLLYVLACSEEDRLRSHSD